MKLIFTLGILFLSQLVFSQSCIPDTTQIPSTSFIYPTPYQDTVPGSGIPNKACIGTEYSQVFQVKIPTSVIFLGFTVHVEKITLNSIDGLPNGLTYDCNPSGCVMLKNTTGCMNIHGTPTADNAIKKYPIKLNFTFTTTEFGAQQLSFPDATIAPGIYEIDLLSAGSPGCLASVNNTSLDLDYSAYINESLEQMILKIQSRETIKGIVELYASNGAKITEKSINIFNGNNEFALNINSLKSGVYFYKIKTGRRFETGKIFIPRN